MIEESHGQSGRQTGTLAPLVTAGVPVYNDVKHIGQVLEDLVTQDYRELEIVVSDNGSTDGTVDVCREFAAADPRVRLLTRPANIGAIENFEGVLDAASGEFFFWASSHDRRERTFVSKCVAPLRDDSHVVLAFPLARWIDAADVVGAQIEPFSDTRHLVDAARVQVVLWSLGYAYPVYGVFRTEALRRTSPRNRCIGGDLVRMAEVAVAGTFACVPETLLYMRRQEGHEDWSRYIERLIGYPPSPWEAEWMIAKLLLAEARAVARIPSRIGRVTGLIGVASSFAVRHRWMLRQVWRDAVTRQRDESGR